MIQTQDCKRGLDLAQDREMKAITKLATQPAVGKEENKQKVRGIEVEGGFL